MLSLKTVRLLRNHTSISTINQTQLHSPTQEIKDAIETLDKSTPNEYIFSLLEIRGMKLYRDHVEHKRSEEGPKFLAFSSSALSYLPHT